MKTCLTFVAAAIAIGLCGCWPQMQMSAAPDGTIYFTSDAKLYRVDKDLSTATEIGKGFYLVEVSPDGKRLLCMKGDAGDTQITHGSDYTTAPESKAAKAEAAKKIHFEMVICGLDGDVLKEVDSIRGETMNAEPVVPRWSPDGRYVSYLWKWPEKPVAKDARPDAEPLLTSGLRVAEADATGKFIIPSMAADHAWSSDSKRIYVFADFGKALGNENATLAAYDAGSVVAVSDVRKKASPDVLYDWQGPVEGETATRLKDLAVVSLLTNADYEWVGCSPLSDGVFFSSRRSLLPVAARSKEAALIDRSSEERRLSGVFEVDAAGDKIKQVADNGPGYGFFRVSPDGKKLLYAVWSKDATDHTASLYVAAIDGSDAQSVGQWATQDVLPIWVGNDRIAYAKDVNNATRIVVKTVGANEVDITGVLNAAGCKLKIVKDEFTSAIPGIKTLRRPPSTGDEKDVAR